MGYYVDIEKSNILWHIIFEDLNILNMKQNKTKILFLDIFTDNTKFKKMIERTVYNGGTYSEHVRKMFGLNKNQWLKLDASKGKFPEKFLNVSGVVIGGSSKDPIIGQEADWMFETYKFINRVIKKNLPILGICGGLQFVVKALGGEIIYNPKGKEFGAIAVHIKKSDPLFRSLSKSFIVPSNHKCMVGKFNGKAKLLASSKMCSIQALAIGDKIRLVQFHPERTKEQNMALAELTRDHLVEDGVIKNKEEYPKFLESLNNNSDAGKIILGNFLNHFINGKN